MYQGIIVLWYLSMNVDVMIAWTTALGMLDIKELKINLK